MNVFKIKVDGCFLILQTFKVDNLERNNNSINFETLSRFVLEDL